LPLPSHLRIGHLTYKVTSAEGYVQTPNKPTEDLNGWSFDYSQRIEISTGGGPDNTRTTVLHEILHQCLRVTGCDPDADAKASLEDIEERAVTAMAGPLLATLRDNPELVDYLLSADSAA
jgi:hypothetical protein